MTYQIELTEQPAQPVLSIRARSAVGDLPRVLGDTYALIMQYIEELDEYPTGAPFVAYYNNDRQDLDLEIGFPVYKAFPGKDVIQSSEIPAGRHACCIHKGPYAQVEPAYEALSQWIKQNGYTHTGTTYEFYLNDPRKTPENELLTGIAFTIK